MSQKSPQRRALTRMPTAGARSWSGDISCADGGRIVPRMDGVKTAPPACKAVSLTASRDGLGAAESGNPCRQSRTSILPVMGLSSPRARCAAHDDQLPSHSGRRFDCYSIPIRLRKLIRRQSGQRRRARPDRSIPSSITHPAAWVRLGWPLGMKPTPIRRRTAHRTLSRQSQAAQIDLDRPVAGPAGVAQLLHSRIRGLFTTLHGWTTRRLSSITVWTSPRRMMPHGMC
jgi:hypothetical protein